jgi:hypothetical protein
MMEERKNLFNIVVLGDMNPRIHTPAWYQLIGLIDQSEMEASVQSPMTMAIPPIAQVQLEGILIQCQQKLWEIRTTDCSRFDRMKSITVKVFDELLMHTPVISMGFNFNYYEQTSVDAVGLYLATCLSRMPLGLESDSLLSGEISLRRSAGDHTIHVNVRPSYILGDDSYIWISNNYEYNFSSDPQKFFNLSETIDSRFETDRSDAQDRVRLVLTAINAGTE